MLRLRTTTSLSAFVLVVSIAGTSWLSTLTDTWRAPAARVALVHHARLGTASHASVAALPRPAAGKVRARRQPPPAPVRVTGVAADTVLTAVAAEPAPELRPLAMPADHSQSWETLRGHLAGRVLVQVSVDAAGRVLASSVSESSGDPLLDDYALRSVRGWRFAVPVDHPDGMSGELPLRFSGPADDGARLP
jgi:protein TonB